MLVSFINSEGRVGLLRFMIQFILIHEAKPSVVANFTTTDGPCAISYIA